MVSDDLKKILKENIDLKVPVEQIGMDHQLADLGIDSFNFVKLITAIEIIFEFEFDENDLIVKNFLTFGSLVNYVERRMKLL